jgi:hypothetical protein
LNFAEGFSQVFDFNNRHKIIVTLIRSKSY